MTKKEVLIELQRSVDNPKSGLKSEALREAIRILLNSCALADNLKIEVAIQNISATVDDNTLKKISKYLKAIEDAVLEAQNS